MNLTAKEELLVLFASNPSNFHNETYRPSSSPLFLSLCFSKFSLIYSSSSVCLSVSVPVCVLFLPAYLSACLSSSISLTHSFSVSLSRSFSLYLPTPFFLDITTSVSDMVFASVHVSASASVIIVNSMFSMILGGFNWRIRKHFVHYFHSEECFQVESNRSHSELDAFRKESSSTNWCMPLDFFTNKVEPIETTLLQFCGTTSNQECKVMSGGAIFWHFLVLVANVAYIWSWKRASQSQTIREPVERAQTT